MSFHLEHAIKPGQIPSMEQTVRWLKTGGEGIAAMVNAIDAARVSVRLEIYIYADDDTGRSFLGTLVRACGRGVSVKVLVDSLGSAELAKDFWKPLREAGGEMRWFNPFSLRRFSIRDHRKILVCDDCVAVIGGFNISDDYSGDGVERGWRDLGMGIEGPAAVELAGAVDEMWELAEFRHQRLTAYRRSRRNRFGKVSGCDVLLSAPGRGTTPFKTLLGQDLAKARDVRIASAYFLPSWRIRRELAGVIRRGGRVQLILPGKSDVGIMLRAMQSLYRRMLGAGIEIWEYQPQVMHTKLIVLDDVTYVGSSNLDTRSLHLNYEVMMRFPDPVITEGARALFDGDLVHCHQIHLEEWKRSRSFIARFRSRLAYLVLFHLDRWLTFRQLGSKG